MSRRDELAARMADVVGHLLRGRTPDGFDEMRSKQTARILAWKRINAMTHLRPEIRMLPEWRTRTTEFAMATTSGQSADWDAQMFVEWVRDHPYPGDADWVVLDDIRSGRRRLARVRITGHTHLIWHYRRRVHSLPSLYVPST